MKTVYLLRHAKAESAKGAQEDIERKLAPAGREACAVVGVYMKKKEYVPDFVLCSAACRTQETFELAMQAAGMSPPYRLEKKLYATTVDYILSQLRLLDDAIGSAMVVGHNPIMHQFALTLAKTKATDMRRSLEMRYPTGALTVLRFAADSWNDVERWQGELVDCMMSSAS